MFIYNIVIRKGIIMTNFQVYRKTLSFSLVMFLVDILELALVVGCATAGFFMFQSSSEQALIGLAVGLVIGIILAVLVGIFINNRVKAAQIAMMTKGVTENALPEHTYKEGFNEIKGRFGKITAFFFITNAIKGIFRQIGRGINKLGTAIGGDAGNAVTSTIDSAIQTLIGYLCDCCLGWILYRKNENAARAGCEGAVIFFKHGKTLIRNIGRIFGMGLLSLLLIGGAFFGLFYLIFSQFPAMFETLSVEILKAAEGGEGNLPDFVSDPKVLMIVVAAIGGIVIWSMIHKVLIRPFILVGVMRNFMAAGQKDLPSEADFNELDSRSPKFAKLHNSF